MEDFLSSLKVSELKKICETYDINGKRKKKELIDALLNADLEICEIQELLDEFELEKRTNLAKEERERQNELDREERIRQAELHERREIRAHEIELARIAHSSNDTEGNNGENLSRNDHVSYDMSKFLRPYKEDGDLGLFLVNFERICTRMKIPRDRWAMCLMTLLPPGAAEVVARLGETEAMEYDAAKSNLLRKLKLTADAYRKKFRTVGKTPNENFGDFAYKLKDNFTEWLNGENVGDSFEKLVQLLCLEQFYANLQDDMKFWIKDRNISKTPVDVRMWRNRLT